MSSNPALCAEHDESARTAELASSSTPQEALAAARAANRIHVRFESFKDGRGFSLAALLRESGFDGELIAAGDILPDQLDFLHRSGFDRAAPDGGASVRWNRKGFSHAYQPAAGRGAPAYRVRTLAARKARTDALNQRLRGAPPSEILEAALAAFEGRIAMLSSFGAEAALGLALLAQIAPHAPVLFLDTRRHFPQTLQYRDRLVAQLGLRDIRTLAPDDKEEAIEDGDGKLYERDTDACCDLRKVRPLARGLDEFDALITGRKRYHGAQREDLDPFEFDGERVRINPFASLSPSEFTALFREQGLPPHPLTEHGYPSIGCWPCTAPVQDKTSREGRWAGEERSECGIFDPERTRRAHKARRNAVRLL